MSLHGDLLVQAGHLLSKEPRRPKQASLRRAVSTAYYALFHLLVDESSRRLISGGAQTFLRALTARAYDHGTMRQASRALLPAVYRPRFRPFCPKEHLPRSVRSRKSSSVSRTFATVRTTT